MSTIASLRTTMKEKLATDLGIEMRSGFAELDEGSVRHAVGFIWSEGFSTSEPAVIQSVEMHARVYLQWIEPRSDAEPIDPEPLEALAEAVRDSIAEIRAAGGWLLRLVGVGIIYSGQYVEGVWSVLRENPYELAETVA